MSVSFLSSASDPFQVPFRIGVYAFLVGLLDHRPGLENVKVSDLDWTYSSQKTCHRWRKRTGEQTSCF